MRKLASFNKFSRKSGVIGESQYNRYREKKNFLEMNKMHLKRPKDIL